MKVTKAVITAAAPTQRSLPLQTVLDRDGEEKPILRILTEEAVRAGATDIAIVLHPGDEAAYAASVASYARTVRFIPQVEPRGYGHAVACARAFADNQPVLHLVGDHLYISQGERGCAQQLVAVAEEHNCSVSSVQPTRENLLPRFGVVAGEPVHGAAGLYAVETVREKPTPTEAERHLIVPGLRAGYYLCFFGMHVLTPAVFEILDRLLQTQGAATLSAALAELPRVERYLAFIPQARRYDIGARYGLLNAQLALALSGADRDLVLTQLVELLAQREPDGQSQ